MSTDHRLTEGPERAGSGSNMSARRRTRNLLAAGSLLVPSAVVLVTGLAWRGALPEQVEFHWDVQGRPDGGFPAEPLYWMSQIGTLVLFAMGLLVLLIPSRDDGDTRKAATILGSVTAFVAGAWFVPAGVTYFAESAERAPLGAWMLLFSATLLYGLIPRALLPRSARSSG